MAHYHADLKFHQNYLILELYSTYKK
jgi:hypothetical protein